MSSNSSQPHTSENHENIPQDILDTFSDYDVPSKLGQGAYGTVYLGVNRTTGERLAIKRCLIAHNETSLPIAALRETNTIAKVLRYPHINLIRAFNVYLGNSTPQTGYTLSIVMEHCDTDLSHYMTNRTHHLPWDHVFSLSHQLLSGMKHLHDLSIIHRDLKPPNILLQMDGTLKITDFGLCRTIGTENTMTNVVVTLWYRPPELLIQGGTPYNSAVDVWSVGIILLELCNGMVPFRSRGDLELIHEQFQLFGFPSAEDWIPGCRLSRESFMTQAKGMNQPPVLESQQGWQRLFPRRDRKDLPEYFVKMILACLCFNMDRRPSMWQLLKYMEDHAHHPLCTHCHPVRSARFTGQTPTVPTQPPLPSASSEPLALNVNEPIQPHQIPLLERYCRPTTYTATAGSAPVSPPYPADAATGARIALACEFFQHRFRNGVVLDFHPNSQLLNETLKKYLQKKTLQYFCRLRALETQAQQQQLMAVTRSRSANLPNQSVAAQCRPGTMVRSSTSGIAVRVVTRQPSASAVSAAAANPFSTVRTPATQLAAAERTSSGNRTNGSSNSQSPSVVLGASLANIRVNSCERNKSTVPQANPQSAMVRRAQSCAIRVDDRPTRDPGQAGSSSATTAAAAAASASVVHRSGAVIHRRRSNYLQHLYTSKQRLHNAIASPSNRASTAASAASWMNRSCASEVASSHNGPPGLPGITAGYDVVDGGTNPFSTVVSDMAQTSLPFDNPSGKDVKKLSPTFCSNSSSSPASSQNSACMPLAQIHEESAELSDRENEGGYVKEKGKSEASSISSLESSVEEEDLDDDDVDDNNNNDEEDRENQEPYASFDDENDLEDEEEYDQEKDLVAQAFGDVEESFSEEEEESSLAECDDEWDQSHESNTGTTANEAAEMVIRHGMQSQEVKKFQCNSDTSPSATSRRRRCPASGDTGEDDVEDDEMAPPHSTSKRLSLSTTGDYSELASSHSSSTWEDLQHGADSSVPEEEEDEEEDEESF